MIIEIVLPNGDLKREVWAFSLDIGYGFSRIYLDHYLLQVRETARHRWEKQTYWSRLDRRSNKIDSPPLPKEVEAEMRKRYQEYIMTLPVKF